MKNKIPVILALTLGLIFILYALLPQETTTTTSGTPNEIGDTKVDLVVQPDQPMNGASQNAIKNAAGISLDPQAENFVVPLLEQPIRLPRYQISNFEHINFDEESDASKAERAEELKELLLSLFGHIPDNPIAALSELDEERLAAMLQTERQTSPTDYKFSEALTLGSLLGRSHDADNLLGWFEKVGVKNGLEGEVLTEVFNWMVFQKTTSMYAKGELRKSPKLAQRILALIEKYLKNTKEDSASTGSSGSIWFSLDKLCPIDGGLDLIRRWTVEAPHGDEATETSLVEMLKHWPIQEAKPLIIETLETNRAGAIKGIVSAWSSTKRGFTAWTVEEAKLVLEAPLSEAVKATKKSTGVLYAAIFAAEDLLKPRALEIADALLARRDNAYVSSLGFSFLKVHKPGEASATWTAWLESNSEYKVLAACMSAGNFREVSSKPNSTNKLFELASKSHNKSDLQGAAGTALCQVDSDYSRTLDILHLWLNAPQMSDPTLVSAGRMVLWGPRDEVETFLLDEISDPHKQPEDRYYAMFLLAVLDPNAALDICEDKDYAGKLTDLTKLLVAAVYGMGGNWQRAKALRESCTEPEPDWIKRIRLRQSAEKSHGLKERAEERVASYARSRP
ncbi:MAG: hypothetical protein L3J82_02090 [Planctomycetes bacterium]|nr:hypothetical protein [Planctomycetota bacterium]